MERPSVLVIGEIGSTAGLLGRLLRESCDVALATGPDEAVSKLANAVFDVAVVDPHSPGGNGLDLVVRLKRASPDTEVILLGGHAAVQDEADALKAGAYACLEKPLDPEVVLLCVARAAEHRRLRRELRNVSTLRPAPVSGTLAKMTYREMLELARERATRDYLVALMRDFSGNVTRAAGRAEVERETLHRLLRHFHVRADDFRRAG